MTVLQGGCHCGRVRFEVQSEPDIEAVECNCSICRMSGYLHLLVPKADFKLLQGEDALENYQFKSRIAKHYFCRSCGIKSFYIPRSHPDGVSVNVRCLNEDAVKSVTVTPFDGANWSKNIHQLSPISD